MQTSIAKKIFAVGAASAMIAAALPFVASAQQHAVGTNVVSNGTVYFINSSNQKQPYTSAGAFLSYGFNSWAGVQAASPEDLALPTGSFVPPMDGSLINDNGTVYIITKGSRAGFTSSAVFTGLGYSFSNVIPGDTSFMNTLTPVSSTAMAHLPGTLVNESGTVYLITSTGTQGIPSLAVFNSWGYSWNYVVPANSYDAALPMSNGIMPAWTMGMLSPLGTYVGTTPTPTPTGTVLPVSGGLSVSLASSTPASAYIAAGSAFNDMADINFTAGSSAVVVTQVAVTRTGLGSDSDINNVYLFEGSTLIAGPISLGSAVGTFVNSNGIFTVPANSTQVISVKADLSSGVTTSKTYAFGINSATAIVTSGNGSVSGSFPITGNSMTSTVLSNPALATLQVQATPVGSTVNAGTQGVLIGQFQFQAQNSNVKLSSLTLTEVGSINASTDLTNLMLKNGSGTQIGTTLSNLSTNNQAVFNLTSNPYTISSGQNVTFSLYANVNGTPNRSFVMSIQRNSDIQAYDTTYNSGILATVQNSGSFPVQQTSNIAVQAGNLVVTTDANSPTGNIPTSVSNQTLAQFDFTASGEPVKINFLPFAIAYTGACPSASGAYGPTYPDCNNSVLANLKLVDSNGVQLGSTFNTPSSAYNYATTTSSSYVNGFTGSFGTSSSPLNYTIAANTTVVVSLKADILTLQGTISGVQANLTTPGAANAQGQTSLASVTTTANNGRSLSLSGSPFVQSVSGALGAQLFVKGSANNKVAEFILTAGAGEGINLTSVTLSTPNVDGTYYPFQNMKVFVNGTQFGTYTQGYVAGNQQYTFSGNPVSIALGGTATVDVYEDIQSGATVTTSNVSGSWPTGGGTLSPAVSLVSAQGSGASSGTSRTSTGGTTAGQNLGISVTAGSLTVSSDSGTVAASNVAMGATGITMGSFKLTTGTVEGANITSIMVTDTDSGTNAVNALQNIKLFNGQTEVGSPVASLTYVSSTSATATFQFSPALVLPVSSVATLTIVADVSPYNSTASTSGTTHTFGIAASGNIVGTGSGSGTAITPGGTFPVSGYAQTVYRTNLTVNLDSASPVGTRVVSSTDQIATFDFKAASNYDAVLTSISIQINGPVYYNAVTLRDANGVISGITCTGGTTFTASAPYATNCETSSTGTLTLALPAGYTISAGTTRAITLEVNTATAGNTITGSYTSSPLAAGWSHTTNGVYNNFQPTITGIAWGDNGGTSNANLAANTLPVTGNTLQY